MQGRKDQKGAVSKYSPSLRMQVALDYEQGDLSYAQVAEKYGLRGRETVREWVKVLRKKGEIVPLSTAPMTEEEKRDLDAKELRIRELEKLLEAERLRSLGLSTMIDVAEEELGGVHPKKVWFQTVQRLRTLPLKGGLGRLCGLFGMTRQSYYDQSWRDDDRRMAEHELLKLVAAQRLLGRFGVRTLLQMMGPQLEELGIRIGRDRLFALLRGHGLLVRPKRRHTGTTLSRHHFAKWPYLLENLEVTEAERVWVCDITYIRVAGGFLYLFLVTDAYSHKVMGYHLSCTLEAKGATAALRMALSRRIHPQRELIHHSDRGLQYCSNNYVKALQDAGIAISMTEGASPHQNTIAERINRTFKEQLYMDQTFEGYEQALDQLVKAVQVYNLQRPHSSCSGLTPEQAHKTTEPLKRQWKNYKAKPPPAEALAALHTSRQV